MLVPHVAGYIFLIFECWFYFRLGESLSSTVGVQLFELLDVLIDLVHCDETLVVLVDHAKN
jgi:hypothetical protein